MGLAELVSRRAVALGFKVLSQHPWLSGVVLVGRPRFCIEVERVFWQQVAVGASTVEAGAVAGVSRATAQRLFAQSGGVMPSLKEPRKPASEGGRLSLAEREEIACLHEAGLDDAEIARRLGRHRSTIGRERGRNSGRGGIYRASTAQQRADENARAGGRARPAKLASNLRLRREVQTRLGQHHSPAQIARRLREDYPDDPEMWVSHETIYQSLFVQGRGGLRRELAACLRTGRAVRRPRRQAQARRARTGPGGEAAGGIKNMVLISERPAEVEDRAVPGHWEGDLIIGKDSASAIGTLVERATRYVLLLHLPHGRSAEQVAEAMITKMAELPDQLLRTLTWDQGTEMANHAQIADATGLDIYFCDPHSPWQRGSNENTNGLLRQYFPKGTDLSFWGPGYLDTVAAELNNRPRQTLNWRTPAEALDKLLSQHDNKPGVADAG
jgi:IS30 family transposase